MTEQEPIENADASTERVPAGGMPRWVKVSLIVVGLLIAVFVVLQLAGIGPKHGPGRHTGPGGQEPSSEVNEPQPPAGVDHGE